MTYLSKACAALVLVQAGAFDAEAQTPPPAEKRSNVNELVDSILKRQDKEPKTPPASPPPPADTGRKPGPLREAGVAAPAPLAEAVRQKIRPCWNPPSGSSAALVAIRVEMNRDATPERAEIQDKARYAADAAFRQAADAAYRTVMNPRCQPWPLPPEKYDTWRTLTFNFDSRDY
jgi:hypothetical protein